MKMPKLEEIEHEEVDNLEHDIVLPVTEIKRSFGYRLTDKKAKSNLIKISKF